MRGGWGLGGSGVKGGWERGISAKGGGGRGGGEVAWAKKEGGGAKIVEGGGGTSSVGRARMAYVARRGGWLEGNDEIVIVRGSEGGK